MANLGRAKQIRYPAERARRFAKSDEAAGLEEIRPSGILPQEAAGEASIKEATMADNGMIAATPYPFYAGGQDNDNEAHKAALVSHAGASIERNQDAGFGFLSRQQLQSEVGYNREVTLQAKYDAVVAQKDAEIRASERFAGIEKELAAIRAEGLQRDVATLRAEVAKGGQDALGAVLVRIAAKLGA